MTPWTGALAVAAWNTSGERSPAWGVKGPGSQPRGSGPRDRECPFKVQRGSSRPLEQASTRLVCSCRVRAQ
jgi:hypothetical protein